jgi:hypothetical protein
MKIPECVPSTLAVCTLIDHKKNVIDTITSSKSFHEKEVLLPIINNILNQNYFQRNRNFDEQTQGLAMEAPTSPMLAEMYMQYLEHSGIYDIIMHHKITGYFMYADNILIIYNNNNNNNNNKADINKTID